MSVLSSSDRLRRLAGGSGRASRPEPESDDVWGLATQRERPPASRTESAAGSEVWGLTTVRAPRDSSETVLTPRPARAPTPSSRLEPGPGARPETRPSARLEARPSARPESGAALPSQRPTPSRPSQRLSAVAPAALSLEPGARIGAYEVRSVLGRGSMGRVLLARDPAGRDVALKVVLPEMCDEEGRARFRREGQAMAAVAPHRNVVTVHSIGEHQGAPYLVMDYVAGEGLEKLLRRGPLPLERAVRMGLGMARALEHVHRAGVLHRDLKPANVIVRADDQEPVLTDFGMATLRGAERLTRTGDLLGTPLYMAPEQIVGLRIDARSEVWALGAILFEMLAGRPPFEGQTLADVSRAVTNDPVPNLRRLRPEVDKGLARIVTGCLRKHPTDRPDGPGAVAEALAEWVAAHAGQPVPQPAGPRSRVVPLLALLALASLGLTGEALWRRWRALSPTAAAPASTSPASPAAKGEGDRLAAAPTPASPPPAEATAALDAPLRAAQAALDRDDPRAAREALTPGLDRAGQGDQARLRALRLAGVAAAPRWLPDPVRRLEGLLLLGALAAWAPAPGTAEAEAEGLLGAQLAQEVRRVEALAREPAEHRAAVTLLEALAASGLRPVQRGQLDRIGDDLWLMVKQAEALPERRVEVQDLYWRGLLALLRLDADLCHSVLLSADPQLAPWRAGRDPLGDWLLLAVKTFRRDQAESARRALGELLRANEAAFEPRVLARGLVLAAEGEEGLLARRELLERAIARDPKSPWARRELADLLVRGSETERARAREEAERGLELYRSLHGERTTTAWELVRFQLSALAAAAAVGDRGRVATLRAEAMSSRELDPERVQWIEERVAEAEERAGGAR